MVLDSNSLTQNAQFALFSSRWRYGSFFMPFLFAVIVLLVFVLFTADADASAVLVAVLAVVRYTNSLYSTPVFISLQDQPQHDFLLTQEEHPLDQSISVFKGMSWTASLPFKGHFCLETDVFDESLESEYDLFEFTTSMYKGCKHIIRFSPTVYSITGGFGNDSGGHRLITDLLQVAKSVGNCSLVSNGRGLRVPSNVQDDRRVLKCSNFRKYSVASLEEGEILSSQNEGTTGSSSNTAPYRVTTYTGDKKNASWVQ